MKNVEEFYGIVPHGEDKGRISNYELAREMAYANKPFEDAFVTGGDEAVDQLIDVTPDFDILDRDTGDRLEEIPGKRIYEEFLKVQRGVARTAIENSRTWSAVKKPSSAGLPTLGKR